MIPHFFPIFQPSSFVAQDCCNKKQSFPYKIVVWALASFDSFRSYVSQRLFVGSLKACQKNLESQKICSISTFRGFFFLIHKTALNPIHGSFYNLNGQLLQIYLFQLNQIFPKNKFLKYSVHNKIANRVAHYLCKASGWYAI